MAEKILNTRILMKVDTLENWNSSTLPLKKGELAFATVAANAGLGLEEPVVMVKIGTAEEKKFSELPWAFHAKAADVVSAAKSEAGLEAFVNGVIAKAGIASNSAVQELAGKVTTAEGEIDTLQSEMDAVEAKAAANETAVAGVKALVGDEAVATQISNAIAALKLEETYAAKSLEKTVSDHVADTVSHVTTADKTKWNAALQAADVAAGSANGTIAVKGTDVAITGLGSAAFTESSAYDAAGAAGTAEANAKAYAKEYADGLAKNYDAAGAAATAEQNAKDYADGLASNYDEDGAAAQALTDAKKYTDDEIKEWVGEDTVAEQISAAIAAEDLANTYAAKSHKHTKADITDFAHTHEIADVNGLQGALDGKQAVGDYATKTEAQGYADAKDEAIAAALKAGQDAQGEVDALETYVGTIPAGATATNVVAYVQEKTAGIATDAALGELQEAVDAIEADYLKAADKTALQGEIDALELLVGDEAVATQISTAVAAEAAIARAAEKENKDAIAKLNGDDKTEGSVDYKVAQEVAKILNDNDATDIDTLEEIAAWIKNDTAGVGALNQKVTDNEAAIGVLNGTGAGSVAKTVADAIAAENLAQYATDTELKGATDRIAAIEGDYLKAADKTELQGKIDAKAAQTDLNAATGRIGALETKVGDTPVQDQITAAIEALKIGDYAKASALTEEINRAKAAEKANADAIALKANDADLAAIAKSGNVNDLVQTTGDVLVFDCGTSAE